MKPIKLLPCEICGEPFNLKFVRDHNHETGKTRAWICQSCNVRVGFYEKEVREYGRKLLPENLITGHVEAIEAYLKKYA